jgi:hypothetical protein
MADTPQTLALLSLGQELRGQIVPQVNRTSALLRLLKLVPGRGQNCAWAVEGDGVAAENFAEGAAAADFDSDTQAQATLPWARVRKNFHITGTARRVAQSAAAGPDGLKDLVGHNLVTRSQLIASKVNQQCFTGNGATNVICGFDEAIGKADNIYAGINRATVGNEYWQPYVADPGTPTPLSFALVRKDLSGIFKKSGMRPDLCFLEPDTFNTFASLFDANRRYIEDVTVAGRGKVVLDGGFEGIRFDGCLFLQDKDAAANTAYYVNTNYVELQYQPLDEKTLAALRSMGVDMNANDGFGITPLGIRAEKLAKTGDADKYMVLTELNLVVKRPNACGVRKNIQLAA